MTLKIIIYNIKKNIDKFFIFYVTCSLLSGFFYSFITIISYEFLKYIPNIVNYERVRNNATIPLILFTCALSYLVIFITNYILNERKKEYALQCILGVSSKFIAKTFFLEILISMFLSIFAGICVGYILHLGIGNIFLVIFTGKFEFVLFPFLIKSAMLTSLVFLLITLCSIFFNYKKIRNLEILDFLKSPVKITAVLNSKQLSKIQLIISSISLILIFALILKLKVSIFFSLSLLLSFLILIFMYMNFFKKIYLVNFFKAIVLIFQSIIIFLIYTNINNIDSNLLIYNQSVLLLFCFVILVVAIISFYCSIGDIIAFLKKNSNTFYNKHIISISTFNININNNIKIVSFLTVCFILSISFIFSVFFFSKWTDNYLEQRIFSDIEMSYNYKNTHSEVPLEYFDELSNIINSELEARGYSIYNSHNFNTYFLSNSDFERRYKDDFPNLILKASDYNKLIFKYNEIVDISKQSSVIQSDNTYITEFPTPYIGEIEYNIENIYNFRIPMSIYNSYTDYIYIINDKEINDKKIANYHLLLNCDYSIKYEDAIAIEKIFFEQTKKFGEFEASYRIRFKTKETVSSNEAKIIIILLLSYSGLLLTIIPLTVLSVQLLESKKNNLKYLHILDVLGDFELRKHIKENIILYLLCPSILAVIISLIFGAILIFDDLSFYIKLIGVGYLFSLTLITVFIFLSIVSLFFIITYKSYWK